MARLAARPEAPRGTGGPLPRGRALEGIYPVFILARLGLMIVGQRAA
jgi:hypothetical protein